LGMDRPQPGLDRMKAVLNRLNHPERCAPAVHIAGTNGKGSTLAFLDALAQAAGRKTARLTSPHLIHVGERLRIDGQITPLVTMEQALEEAWSTPGGEDLTYFESVVVASFLLAHAAKPDLLLVETGLGGRWDATNVVDTCLHLFSPIDIDHTAYLGETLGAIAAEKGGIIRCSSPAISAPQVESVGGVLHQAAQNHGAPWRRLQPQIDFGGSWQHARFCWRADWLPEIELPLPGDHQVENAALAIAAAEHLFPNLAPETINAALGQVRWEGRLERYRWRSPSGDEIEVILDGAHNPAGMDALAGFLRGYPALGTTRILLGVMGDKDVSQMIRILEGLSAEMAAVGWDETRALDRQGWQRIAPQLPFMGDPVLALAQILGNCSRGDRVVVAGSLHLLGFIRRRWSCSSAT